MSRLQKIVLQPTDLPAGWKGTPYQADPSAAADQAAFAKCVGVRNTDVDKVAEANSQDFARGDASISSSATSFRSQSDVDADVAALHSSKFAPCVEQLLKKQIVTSLPAATVESVSIKIKPGSAGGPTNVVANAAGTIKVSMSGQQVVLYVTNTFITGPLIEADVETDNVGRPVRASLVKSLVASVANRAAEG
jgi:hypothetical protein